MQAIVNTGPGELCWMERPLPQPAPGQVRVRTGACGICATDLHMIAGWQRTSFPAIPGHEWSGVIDATGDGVPADLLGRRCVGENILSDGGEVGFEHPGGYGEYLVTEASNIYLLPDDFPFGLATLIEPLAVAVRGIRRLRATDLQSALVLGDGVIGLLTLLLLRRAGIERVVMVGGRVGRLKLACELGAAATVNYHQADDNLVSAIMRVEEKPFPNVIEASGSPWAAQTALEVTAPEGHIVILGDYGEARSNFRWNHLLHHEIELIGSNASAGAWPEAVRLAVSGELPLQRLVTHQLPAKCFAEGIELVRSRRDDVIKVVLEWL
jgi:2-desacetyl-2-hydroxyethyl bacteriochlorophyllide A dehydrogenase